MRSPAVSGRFYPSNSQQLNTNLTSFFNQNKPSNYNKSITGVIVPHAGYQYSGKLAALALSCISIHKPATYVIIGPSHYHSFSGISIYQGDGYRTPLGDISINKDLRSRVQESYSESIYVEEAHEYEHSIEVQLPFLQFLHEREPFTILPIITGRPNHDSIQKLVNVLGSVKHDNIIFVASTDMSHFYSNKIANKIDLYTKGLIESRAWDLLFDANLTGESELCGLFAVMVVGRLLSRYSISILDQYNSGDISGDFQRVVGYCSGVFLE